MNFSLGTPCRNILKKEVLDMIKAIAVDDEYSILKLLPHIIDWSEYGIELAEVFPSADAALLFMQSEEVDVVFSDICMPGTDGIEFAKILSEQYPHTIVIFLSAYKDFEYAQGAIKYGVFDYITKPLDFDELDRVLSRLSKKLSVKQSIKNSYTIYERQQLLLDYFSGTVGEAELRSSLCLPDDLCAGNAPAALLKITAPGLVSFLKNKWAYGVDRLYSCLIRFLENDLLEVVPLNLSLNNTDLIVFSRAFSEQEAFLELLEEMRVSFSDICKKELSLSAELEISEVYSGLDEIKTASQPKQIRPNAQKSDKNADIVCRALEYIDENLSNDISLSAVAGSVYLSPYHFSRIFKQIQKESFSDFILRKRLEYAQTLLKTQQYTVSQIAEMTGFMNRNYFHRVFKHNIGCTPKEYIRSELEKDKGR